MAVKEGTADIKKPGAVVVKSTGDVRKIRCPNCKTGLALKSPDGRGGVVWRCTSCRKDFSSTAI